MYNDTRELKLNARFPVAVDLTARSLFHDRFDDEMSVYIFTGVSFPL